MASVADRPTVFADDRIRGGAKRSTGTPLTASWRHHPTSRGITLPPQRTASLSGDELGESARWIRLFRDSYAAAQGRQWLQPHVLWWMLNFLRDHDVFPDWDVVSSPALASTVTGLSLPAGHTQVRPADQTALNFRLWWQLTIDLAHAAYRPWWQLWRRRDLLPDTAALHDRVEQLGLRPWVSSATEEEIAGIGHAMTLVPDRRHRGPKATDEFMVLVLLPELLVTELHWLHSPQGRPRTGNGSRIDVLLLRRYEKALAKWEKDGYLTPLDHMYLRAGDILGHLSARPTQSLTPPFLRIIGLYDELLQARDSKLKEVGTNSRR